MVSIGRVLVRLADKVAVISGRSPCSQRGKTKVAPLHPISASFKFLSELQVSSWCHRQFPAHVYKRLNRLCHSPAKVFIGAAAGRFAFCVTNRADETKRRKNSDCSGMGPLASNAFH